MSEYPVIRTLNRYLPWIRILTCSLMATELVAVGLWFGGQSQQWDLAPIALAPAGACLLRVWLFSERILLVFDNGLTVIRRPRIRLSGNCEYFPRANIRCIRYRSDICTSSYEDGWCNEEIRCCLELMTRDTRIVKLIAHSLHAPPRHLGQDLADALYVRHEEYLAPGPE